MHILLVEDNEGDIFLLTELLGERKSVQKVSVAKNGQEGLDFVFGNLLTGNCPDLVLLDINLPMKNGFEVLKELKSDEVTRKIPVIMLTSSSSPADINHSYSSYANLYLTKPSEMNYLEDAIGAIETFWMKIVQLPS
jgi:CheY-like chemotaxis protein